LYLYFVPFIGFQIKYDDDDVCVSLQAATREDLVGLMDHVVHQVIRARTDPQDHPENQVGLPRYYCA